MLLLYYYYYYYHHLGGNFEVPPLAPEGKFSSDVLHPFGLSGLLPDAEQLLHLLPHLFHLDNNYDDDDTMLMVMWIKLINITNI